MTMKKCKECLIEYSIEAFHVNSAMKEGRINKCKHCVLACVYKWRSENPECRKEEHRRFAERSGIRTRDVYDKERKENAIGHKVSKAKYSHKRRIRLRESVMTELDTFVLEQALSLCKEREETTGFKWSLDHIIPLYHKDVSGLHTASNFQVVPALWNSWKGNRNCNTYNIEAGY